ncbi:MAG TPA: tRNA lysidine(34) synthetase TilS [Spirochaetia bacterium]|nr:tRNA lysidine(34) synthetase TilS [Spirochaetia bacterium]
MRADAFSWPLCVRSRRPGDRLAARGGAKRVDAILSELGLGGASRDAVPIVEDASGVVAVLASCAGLRDVYRLNDALSGEPVGGYLVLELKGVMNIDAVRR